MESLETDPREPIEAPIELQQLANSLPPELRDAFWAEAEERAALLLNVAFDEIKRLKMESIKEQPVPASFKVEVKTYGGTNWDSNRLRFATREGAESYGRDLSWRWTAVTEWQVATSTDQPNM